LSYQVSNFRVDKVLGFRLGGGSYIWKQKTSLLAGAFLNLVEAGGVEPPSEKVTTGTSPGADRSLNFAAGPSTDELTLGYPDNLSIRLRELANERPGFFDARPGLPG
jgi:hypothetical protein